MPTQTPRIRCAGVVAWYLLTRGDQQGATGLPVNPKPGGLRSDSTLFEIRREREHVEAPIEIGVGDVLTKEDQGGIGRSRDFERLHNCTSHIATPMRARTQPVIAKVIGDEHGKLN